MRILNLSSLALLVATGLFPVGSRRGEGWGGAHRGVSVDIVEVFVRLRRVRRAVVEGIVVVGAVDRDWVLGGGGGRVRGRRGALVVIVLVRGHDLVSVKKRARRGVVVGFDRHRRVVQGDHVRGFRTRIVHVDVHRSMRVRDPRDVRASSPRVSPTAANPRQRGSGGIIPAPPFSLLARERGRGMDRGTRTRKTPVPALSSPRRLVTRTANTSRVELWRRVRPRSVPPLGRQFSPVFSALNRPLVPAGPFWPDI